MPVVASINPAVLDSVDGVFTKHHVRGAAPSVAWGVFDPSGLQHFASAGELDSGAAPRRDTAYRIASCTKSFTAAALLSLRDVGALALDDPVTRFIPAFETASLPSADAPVPTVRMLLTMSAGLPTDDPWADRQESISADDLDALLQRGLSFESMPGTRFAYSNLGYALLGRVIERAAGRRYRDFVRDTFLEPLALTCTDFDSSIAGGADGAELAVGRRWSGEGWEPLPFSAPGAFSPIGGLFSTVTDLSRWAGWLAEGFVPVSAGLMAGEEPEPLSRASRREMQQLHRLVPGLDPRPGGYGFGLFVEAVREGESVISHSGGYPGFSSHMRWSSRTGLGIVAFENATYARVSVPAAAAFELLLKEQVPEPDAVWPATRAAQQVITEFLREPSHAVPNNLFADNMELDDSWERRRAAFAHAVAEIGDLAPDDANSTSEESAGPAHLVWFIAGRAGRLRVEIQLNPERPALVQTLKVSPDRA